MTVIPVWRRLALSALALMVSALLLRGQISSAIVLRGDQEAYVGHDAHANALYLRALYVDPHNAVAVDRFAFGTLSGHRPRMMRRGIRVASRYLIQTPRDATVLMDRALLEEALGHFADAERDFGRVALLRASAQAYTFAGFAALRAGDRKGAVAYWHGAARIDASYVPARVALARIGC